MSTPTKVQALLEALNYIANQCEEVAADRRRDNWQDGEERAWRSIARLARAAVAKYRAR